ncbi:transcriptional regulator [Acidaminobacter sp. JC074]|uniref:helix-turn-helix transcriptional regulator n=1 Tax=Acidaminobacter sp. JC074 TaxID=2530199 RepID=UPI001F0FAB88|nr:helix-turn-helix transcriptional regulator [Acidaminobacter sp. JC074]MCH4887050.1 transcriptional regulator [Acidaminobacter sp. JC074]
MKSIKDEIKTFENIVKAIAAQFGSSCEVVMHDFSDGYENSIKLVENGHVTGRKVGSSITNMGLEKLNEDSKELQVNGGIHNYTTMTKDGKTLRSSSAMIQDDEGNIIGSLCINFDMTDFIHAANTLNNFSQAASPKVENEVFVNDVNELLDTSLKECVEYVGKPVPLMNKEDKVKAISYLDKKGVFLITKSGNKVCDLFGISKYTLYSYLDEVRK